MSDDLQWRAETRRRALRRQQRLNGIDYVRLGDDRRRVTVVFFRRPPEDIGADNFAITSPGGRRLRIVTARLVEPADRDIEGDVELVLDRPGGLATYHLGLVGVADVDPRYASVAFRFGEDLDAGIDCAAPPAPEPPVPDPPDIDYLAKDYAGFRRLALDRLSQTMPAWTERHVPDLGIVLVELMAYVGDHLSYYQDAVATEAYLATSRLRTSVRRHARLIDYRMHEGCNARAWVHLRLPPETVSLRIAADDIRFTVGDPDAPAVAFAPLTADPITLFAAHNEIAFYDWGNTECWLPAGATSATLRDDWADQPHDGQRARWLDGLAVGDVLLIETVRDPADHARGSSDLRHFVRLTEVTRDLDPLFEQPVVEVAWSAQDALPVLAPLATDAGQRRDGIVARANIVLVDHGRLVEEVIPAQAMHVAGVPAFAARPRRPVLREPGLTFRAPPPDPSAPASEALRQDPRLAAPQILALTSHAADEADPHRRVLHWQARPDLIESGPDDCHYVVEMDDDGFAALRFGDGELGRAPGAGEFRVLYRVGSGPSGEVGAETIVQVTLAGQPDAAGLVARNPRPSSGATLPETMEDVKLLAPAAFRHSRERAITADDYASIAERVPGVRRAAADLVRLGARRVARVAIAPLGSDTPSPELRAKVEAALLGVRRIGHDVHVRAAAYAPLDIALLVGVKPDYLRGHVLTALRAVLGAGVAPDGTRGLFHPDRLDFGATLHASTLIAAAQNVAGVAWVQVIRLQRLEDLPDPADPTQPLENADLVFDGFEIPQLDNDPRHPGRGRLELLLEGGR